MAISDALAILVMFLVTDWRTAVLISAVAAPVWVGTGLYQRRLTHTIFKDAPPLAAGAAAGTALAAVLQSPGPLAFVQAFTTLVVVALIARGVAYVSMNTWRTAGHEVFPALVVGSGPAASLLIERAASHPETGVRIIGWLRDDEPAEPAPRDAAPHLGSVSHLERVLARTPVSDVFLCGRDDEQSRIVEQLRKWSSWQSIAVHKVPNLMEFHRAGLRADEVWGIPVDTLRNPWANRTARRLKRIFDFTLSAIALALLSPLMAIVALAVRLELGSGVIFRQVRVGLDGEPFEMLKFRSMRPTPRHQWSVTDPRAVGAVGRFIRRASLDELPQLVNVLRGDMSLVGPRPETPKYVKEFSTEIDGYAHRHRVPVGLTGLAASRGLRGDTSLQERVYFDNHYIENWSLGLDLMILLRTVSAVLRGSGA